MHAVQLSTGHDMPMLGLGTFQLRGPRCVASVEAALTMGYRHIDTAWRYENQREVGEGIRASGVPYDEIFLTSKIWRDQLSKTAALTQHQENLDQLGFEYVDLLLIHWPPATVPLEETLDVFAQLQEEGKTRVIGVSNFSESLVDEARRISRVQITVNQIRYNLHSQEEKLREHCQERGVVVTAYTPLERGRVADSSAIREIAQYHGKTPIQVALRWLVQKEVIVIPKASSEDHLRENLDLFNWELTQEEMIELDGLTA